jgi:urease accessory protein
VTPLDGPLDRPSALRFVPAGGRTAVHTARASSPTKLLLPGNRGRGAWAYVASLGGGLVDGDAVSLAIDVDPGARALVATQASTKVYRSPRGTSQAVRARVGSGALLACLPDPVSCFAGARYAQSIDVELAAADASLVLVDALTCGRAARGERWQLARYASTLRVSREGRVVANDAVLLDPAHGPVALRMGRFDAVATVIAVGPLAAGVRASLAAAARDRPEPGAPVMHAATALADDASLGRLAAVSARHLVASLRALLAPVAEALGDDPFARRW